jgi:hypothetical protein
MERRGHLTAKLRSSSIFSERSINLPTTWNHATAKVANSTEKHGRGLGCGQGQLPKSPQTEQSSQVHTL